MLDVLIVDDSAAIRKILQRVLRQAKIPLGEVYEASDGAEALETLKKQIVGLVLSDINMPKMDGFEFLTKVRAEPMCASRLPPNRSKRNWLDISRSRMRVG